MADPLRIPAELLAGMLDHLRRELPNEGCGLLLGRDALASELFPLRNVSNSPVHYSADPQDLITAYHKLRADNLAIVAIYHSHPRTSPIPSRVDLRENYYGDVPRIIVSFQIEPPEVRNWRLDPDSFEELPWVSV